MKIYDNWRTKFVWFIVLVLFLFITYKLSNLMLMQRSFLLHQGVIRSERVQVDAVSRGNIYDRNHNILAESFPSGYVWFHAKDWDKVRAVKALLLEKLNVNFEVIKNQISAGNKRVILKSWLSPAQLLWLNSYKNNFLRLEAREKRYYPWAETSANLLGIVGLNGYGLEGVEKAYDKSLQSVKGKYLIEKNLKGEFVKIKNKLSTAKNSLGVDLTIDSSIQDIAYYELMSGIAKFGAESGSVVVIKPKSGEIIAMTNYPSFNPNNTQKINPSHIRNRAITDLFEPGSTIKPLVLAAALENKVISFGDSIDTGNGTFKIFGHEITDEFNKHGVLPLTDILKKSSNVAMSKIAMSLDPGKLPNMLMKFGFSKSALNFPGEASGHITSKAWFKSLEQVTLSFGYGLNVNALQLAHAYAILANSGFDVGIHLNKHHAKFSKEIISPATANGIIKMLVHVTDWGGTGHQAKIPGVDVAGKTGTSRIAGKNGYRDRKYIASFIGAFPARNPEWLVLVVVKKPNLSYYFGGQAAAPIFSKIGQRILNLERARHQFDPTGL